MPLSLSLGAAAPRPGDQTTAARRGCRVKPEGDVQAVTARSVGAGRYDIVDELLHVDLVDHNRYEGQPDGRAGDVWAAQMVRRAFPDLRFVPDLVVSDGEYVVGRWTMTGTNTGSIDLFGLPPTGRPVTMTGRGVSWSVGCSLRRGMRNTCPGCSRSLDYSHLRF